MKVKYKFQEPKSRIFLTGDLHGHIGFNKLREFNKSAGSGLTKTDYLIILGDFGLIFSPIETDTEKKLLNWLDKEAKWTTLFIDGNHENFSRLWNKDNYPIEKMFQNDVSKINNSVYYLHRGLHYSINGLDIITIGGAGSIDKQHRIPGISWWPEETIKREDIDRLQKSMTQCQHRPIILSHCAPKRIVDELINKKKIFGPSFFQSSEYLLDEIYDIYRTIKAWFFGHYHCDCIINNAFTPLSYNNNLANYKFRCLYKDIIELDYIRYVDDSEFNTFWKFTDNDF